MSSNRKLWHINTEYRAAIKGDHCQAYSSRMEMLKQAGEKTASPGDSVIENPSANAGVVGSIPGWGASLHAAEQLPVCQLWNLRSRAREP